MASSGPTMKLLLLQDFRASKASDEGLEDLRRQITALPGFEEVELMPRGRSVVEASVPARNQRNWGQLRALVNEKVAGWRVIDEQNYQLPTTF